MNLKSVRRPLRTSFSDISAPEQIPDIKSELYTLDNLHKLCVICSTLTLKVHHMMCDDPHTNTHKQSQMDFLAASYLVSVHEALAVAGSLPGNVRQRLSLGHAGDHGGAALYGCHVFQLGDVGLDWRARRTKRKGEQDERNKLDK